MAHMVTKGVGADAQVVHQAPRLDPQSCYKWIKFECDLV